jgi:uncharacterized membrane protein
MKHEQTKNKEKNDKVVPINLWKNLALFELSAVIVLFSISFSNKEHPKKTQDQEAHLIKNFNPTLLTNILIMLFIKKIENLQK